MKGTQKPDDMAECSQMAIFLHSQPVSPKGEESKIFLGSWDRGQQTPKKSNLVVNWRNTSDLPIRASWLWVADDASPPQLDCSFLSGPGG